MSQLTPVARWSRDASTQEVTFTLRGDPYVVNGAGLYTKEQLGEAAADALRAAADTLDSQDVSGPWSNWLRRLADEYEAYSTFGR